MLFPSFRFVPQASVLSNGASITGTTSPTSSASFTLPRNSVGPGGFIKIFPQFSCTSSANAKTATVQIGGVVVHAIDLTSNSNSLRPVYIYCKNSNTSQIMQPTAGVTGIGTVAGAENATAIDFTTDLLFDFIGTLTNSGETMKLEKCYVEIWNVQSLVSIKSQNFPKVFASNTTSSVTGTVTPTTLATFTLPGGLLGPTGVVRITNFWTCTNSANTKTCSITFGATTVQNVAVTTSAALGKLTHVWNTTSGTQRIFSTTDLDGVGRANGGTVGSSTVDTNSDVVINIVGTLTNTGETISLESVLIEILRDYSGS